MQYRNSTGPSDNINVDVDETLHYGTTLLIQMTEVQHLINIICR